MFLQLLCKFSLSKNFFEFVEQISLDCNSCGYVVNPPDNAVEGAKGS